MTKAKSLSTDGSRQTQSASRSTEAVRNRTKRKQIARIRSSWTSNCSKTLTSRQKSKSNDASCNRRKKLKSSQSSTWRLWRKRLWTRLTNRARCKSHPNRSLRVQPKGEARKTSRFISSRIKSLAQRRGPRRKWWALFMARRIQPYPHPWARESRRMRRWWASSIRTGRWMERWAVNTWLSTSPALKKRNPPIPPAETSESSKLNLQQSLTTQTKKEVSTPVRVKVWSRLR